MTLRAVNGIIDCIVQSLHLAWCPGADGVFLTDNPQNLVKNGYVADVPFINGVSISFL